MPKTSEAFSSVTVRKADEPFRAFVRRGFSVELTTLDSSEKAAVV